MAPERLFTKAELDALCVPGAARILAALDPLDRARAKAIFRDVDSAYREFHQIYHAWVGTIFEFLFERHGHDAVTQAVPLGGGLVAASAMKLDAEAMSLVAEAPQRFEAFVDAGEIDDARGLVHRHAVVARELERIGAPWPPIHCPKTAGEPCRILFYKDPKRVDEGDWARVGMKPPK